MQFQMRDTRPAQVSHYLSLPLPFVKRISTSIRAAFRGQGAQVRLE